MKTTIRVELYEALGISGPGRAHFLEDRPFAEASDWIERAFADEEPNHQHDWDENDDMVAYFCRIDEGELERVAAIFYSENNVID